VIVEVPNTVPHELTLSADLVPSEKRVESDCDLYGRILIDGVQYMVHAWNRRDPAGRPWLKLRLQRRSLA
jgi:hypothetical protein